MSGDFTIDPDIRVTRTLPARVYSDPAIFLEQRDRVFARETGVGAGLDRVEREDEEVVESVQRGVRSRLYDRGRYSPTRETGVHHFHRLLAEHMRS